MNHAFTQNLLRWHSIDNDRILPWKEEKDPYKIWLSEIILQQTRAQQGLPYYQRFVETYPNINMLAAAPDQDVFRLWQGLGYYSRCKNLLATARFISQELGGTFPNTYEEICKLKGIGPYTAAAIASFAFGLPTAVVDGNVIRVLSRYFRIQTPFDTTAGKKEFTALAGKLIDENQSALYNQAIMDLGATVCTPANPKCVACPLEKECLARKNGITAELPVKSKKTAVRTRFFNYILLRLAGEIWIHKRSAGDIWENLYEPFLIESDNKLSINELLKNASIQLILPGQATLKLIHNSKQRLTHRIIDANFYLVEPTLATKPPIDGGVWIPLAEIKNFAFPKTVVTFFENFLYF